MLACKILLKPYKYNIVIEIAVQTFSEAGKVQPELPLEESHVFLFNSKQCHAL